MCKNLSSFLLRILDQIRSRFVSFEKKTTGVNSGKDSATKGVFTLNMANSVADDKTSQNVCKYSPASIDVLQASILCANIMVEEDKKQ